eukprot:gene26339-31817_t
MNESLLGQGNIEEGEESLFPGKRYFQISGALLAGAGIVVIATAACVVYTSGGNFIGGMYAGVSSLLLGFSMVFVDVLFKSHYGVLLLCIMVNAICCAVALGITADDTIFLDNLAACGSYSSSLDTSCGVGVASFVDCVGDEDYFNEAYACELSFAQDHGGSVESDQCECVTSAASADDGDYTCHNFKQINSCADLLDTVPTLSTVALIGIALCSFLTLTLCALAVVSYLKPQWLRSVDVHNKERSHLATSVPAGDKTDP